MRCGSFFSIAGTHLAACGSHEADFKERAMKAPRHIEGLDKVAMTGAGHVGSHGY